MSKKSSKGDTPNTTGRMIRAMPRQRAGPKNICNLLSCNQLDFITSTYYNDYSLLKFEHELKMGGEILVPIFTYKQNHRLHYRFS